MDPFTYYRVDDCIGEAGTGVNYHEISCLYPSMGRFYLGLEKFYDPIPVQKWMKAHPHLPISIVVFYGVAILIGKSMMKGREPFKWRKGLVFWNLCLSIFSIMGTVRTLPILIHNMKILPLRVLFCADPVSTYGSGSSGLWVQLFTLSKIPELFDTLFIIVHKKPLIFLHWYHHITVLLYCWHSYVTASPFCLFFVCMNYAVHGIMYGYYCLTTARCKPKWLNPIIITILQIAQMIVGVIVTILAFYYHNYGNDTGSCHIQKENNIGAFTMYGSYLFLFLQFFIRRYLKGSSVKVKIR